MKTVDNILRGMRRIADEAERGDCYDLRGLGTDSLRAYADRIEEAHKRELEATREYSSQVGNTAKMLEALQKIVLLTVKAGMSIRFEIALGIIASTARCALASTPRNCDVGTAEEQFKRFDRWCNSRVLKNCLGLDCRKCFIAWSQMPYEASEMKDYSNVRAVCFDCARKAGFVQKNKAVVAFEDECGICKARRPCTDLRNDWMPPKKESDVK